MGKWSTFFGKKKDKPEKGADKSLKGSEDREAAQEPAGQGKEDKADAVKTDAGNTDAEKAHLGKADAGKPLQNFRLKVLLRDMRENRTETGMNMLFEEIVMKARFLSIISLSKQPERKEDGTAIFRKDTTIKIPMITNQGGKNFYPVFTDYEELAKWEQMGKPDTLVLDFDDYTALVMENDKAGGIVINPFGDNFIMDRKMLVHLKTQKDLRLKGVSQSRITKDTKVLVGAPKEYPTAMVDAMREHMLGVKTVSRAWLRLMVRDNVQSFLVIVEFEGNRDEIFGGIAAAARPHLKNMYLDMLPYQEGFGKRAVENVEPFYRRL